MKTGTIVKWSLITSFVCSIIGAYLKIMHVNFADALLIITLFASLIFIVSAIYEVIRSSTIKNNEKTMWIIGLIFMTFITGFMYLVSGRKKIVVKL